MKINVTEFLWIYPEASRVSGRNTAIPTKMEEDVEKPGYTVQCVIFAGIRAALEFTLNRFTAPLAASDVPPFSAVSDEDREEIENQVRRREEMKRIYERLGGEIETGSDHSLERPWGGRRGSRLPSPQRGRVSGPDDEDVFTDVRSLFDSSLDSVIAELVDADLNLPDFTPAMELVWSTLSPDRSDSELPDPDLIGDADPLGDFEFPEVPSAPFPSPAESGSGAQEEALMGAQSEAVDALFA